MGHLALQAVLGEARNDLPGYAQAVIGVAAVAVVGGLLYVITVCFDKGKEWTALLGFFLFLPAVFIGAIRLAKPDSEYAKKYSPEKLAAAQRRFPDEPQEVAQDTAPLYRECPFCKEQMPQDASVCPQCGRGFMPRVPTPPPS